MAIPTASAYKDFPYSSLSSGSDFAYTTTREEINIVLGHALVTTQSVPTMTRTSEEVGSGTEWRGLPEGESET